MTSQAHFAEGELAAVIQRQPRRLYPDVSDLRTEPGSVDAPFSQRSFPNVYLAAGCLCTAVQRLLCPHLLRNICLSMYEDEPSGRFVGRSR